LQTCVNSKLVRVSQRILKITMTNNYILVRVRARVKHDNDNNYLNDEIAILRPGMSAMVLRIINGDVFNDITNWMKRSMAGAG
jgi:hypothetical protein